MSGKNWQATGIVFSSSVGTALDAANVRRMFRRVVAGLDPAGWTPRELRHSFVSLLSEGGVSLEDIAELCGHAGTRVTEAAYPTRAGTVLARYAGIDTDTGQLTEAEDGRPRRLVISSDFYTVYASAGRKTDGLNRLYCWAHIRRYFVRAGDANPTQLAYWTRDWLDRIKALYATHDELTDAWNASAAPAPGRTALQAAARLADAYTAWDTALEAIEVARQAQMKSPGLRQPARKALATLDREWDGLAAHRDYPMISLDNNASERALRRPVVTRKNAYGSRTAAAAPPRRDRLDRHRDRRTSRPQRPDLPHRQPRRLRP
jgi:hypothetical protein